MYKELSKTDANGNITQHVEYVPAVYPDVSGAKYLWRKEIVTGAHLTCLTARSAMPKPASATPIKKIDTFFIE